MNKLEMANILALVVTLIALILSIWQLLQARDQTNKLHEIHNSLSTRYIAPFPEYMSEVIKRIEQARTDVQIMVEFPAHCCFTDRESWLKYNYVIQQKREKGVLFDLTCPIESRRRAYSYEELSIVDGIWKEWKKKPKYRERLMKILPAGSNIDSLSIDDLVDTLENYDKKVLKDVFAGADVKELDRFMPLYFWIVDGEVAIFAFSVFGEETKGYGFFTSDQRFIKALIDIKSRYRSQKQLAMPQDA